MELRDEQESLVLRLAPEERRIVLDRLMSRRSWKDIAPRHGLTPTAARKRFERAIVKVRAWHEELLAQFAEREEPAPEDRPPAMRVTTIEDMECYIADIERSGIVVSESEKAEMLALCARRRLGGEAVWG
jgi:hypothetical protein